MKNYGEEILKDGVSLDFDVTELKLKEEDRIKRVEQLQKDIIEVNKRLESLIEREAVERFIENILEEVDGMNDTEKEYFCCRMEYELEDI